MHTLIIIILFDFVIAKMESKDPQQFDGTKYLQSRSEGYMLLPWKNEYDDNAPSVGIEPAVEANPLLAATILSSILGTHQKAPGFNHPQHLPINPYVALLLSHYGRYIPLYGVRHGVYGYSASNNYHNNKPFGAYKIYEDRDI